MSLPFGGGFLARLFDSGVRNNLRMVLGCWSVVQ